MKKEAVGNLGVEELAFLKQVRVTHNDTAREAEAMFTTSHQSLDRDTKLLNRLFLQTQGSLGSRYVKTKEASTEQFEQYEKIKIAYNVHHFFESGADLTPAQRRFPELLKVAKMRPSTSLKKVPSDCASTGQTAAGATVSGASV